MVSDDLQSRAGEYVLGTLPPDERAAFERALPTDDGAQAAVRAWEARLGPLADAAPELAPAPSVWAALERALAPASPDNVVSLDGLRRSAARWKRAALGAGALAASLALFILADRALRDPAQGEQYVAVVNRGGEQPALIVRVDTRTGTVLVRSVGAEVPADRSLELWYIAEGASPRSLGTVDDPASRRPLPAVAGGSDLAGATFAVTVEPRGGSPTGGPTGPVVYSGRLIREQP